MITITDELLKETSNKAKTSVRKRCNYNFHKSNTDPIQRFINALEPDTYLRPHKHANPDKTEIFLILKGRVLIVEFDDNGKVIDYFILDYKKGNQGVEIPPKTWHSFIALQESSILYEIKEGPFIKETDKIFAKWSPAEGTNKTQEFNKKILQKIK